MIFTKSFLYLQIFLWLALFFQSSASTLLKLETVQVLFRHGDRTPSKKETYPKLPLDPSYETLGYGELTEVGKQRAYQFGKMLRQRYDQFLGEAHYGDVYAISTDYDRTKVSLQLVLKGLYPSPTNRSWDQIGWSPMPTHYFPILLDTVFSSQICPTYINEWRKAKSSDTVKRKLSQYNDLFEYLSKETDLSRDDPLLLVARLYQLLISQRSMNITLPEWASEDVQRRMEEIVSLDYQVQSFTTKMKRLNGGAIVKRFIENIRNRTSTPTIEPKIYLYSGHDINIASFAKVNDFSEPKIPTYGSAIIVETLKSSIGTRFIRVGYPLLIYVSLGWHYGKIDTLYSSEMLENLLPARALHNADAASYSYGRGIQLFVGYDHDETFIRILQDTKILK